MDAIQSVTSQTVAITDIPWRVAANLHESKERMGVDSGRKMWMVDVDESD